MKIKYIIIGVSIIFIVPILLNIFLHIPAPWYVIGEEKEWLAFWVMYIAAIASFVMAYQTWKTIKQRVVELSLNMTQKNKHDVRVFCEKISENMDCFMLDEICNEFLLQDFNLYYEIQSKLKQLLHKNKYIQVQFNTLQSEISKSIDPLLVSNLMYNLRNYSCVLIQVDALISIFEYCYYNTDEGDRMNYMMKKIRYKEYLDRMKDSKFIATYEYLELLGFLKEHHFNYLEISLWLESFVDQMKVIAKKEEDLVYVNIDEILKLVVQQETVTCHSIGIK